MVQRTHKWCSVAWNGSALCRMVQRTHKWCNVAWNGSAYVEGYSVHTNNVALREMALRNVEWYRVDTNGVALCRIASQNIRRSSWKLNCLALYEIFRCCGQLSSLFWAWREGYLDETTKNTNRKWNSSLLGGKTSAKPSHSVIAMFKSLHFALPQSRGNSVSFSSLFFRAAIAFIRCRSWKRYFRIATRVDSTTVCRPPGLPQFARFGEPECYDAH